MTKEFKNIQSKDHKVIEKREQNYRLLRRPHVTSNKFENDFTQF